MQALQCTLSELQKEERDMAAQRLCGQTQADGTEQEKQQVHKELLTRVKLSEGSFEKA